MRSVGFKLNQGTVLSLLIGRKSSEGACLYKLQWQLGTVFLLHASYHNILEAFYFGNSSARIKPPDTGYASVA